MDKALVVEKKSNKSIRTVKAAPALRDEKKEKKKLNTIYTMHL